MTQNNNVHPRVLRWNPNHLHLRLSVSEGHLIDRKFDLPLVNANGDRLTNQHEMRRGLVIRAGEHVSALAFQHPDEDVLAYVGNGNLGANYNFVGWSAGQLHCLVDEPIFNLEYACIVKWTDGRVTVEDLWFGRENGLDRVLLKTPKEVRDITNEIEFATSGQPLVRNSASVPLESISRQFYDTRHLLQPLRLGFNGDALFFPNTQLQQGLQLKALGQSVHIRLEARADENTVLPLSISGWRQLVRDNKTALTAAESFLRKHSLLNDRETIVESDVLFRVAEATEGLLDRALAEGSYQLVEGGRPLTEGEARFINGHLEIFFKKAIYPHNIFVRWPDNTCGFVVFAGKSGREGTTISSACEFLANQLAVKDAVLLDNGGDARLWYRGQHVVPPSEKREEISSILALTARKAEWLGGAITVW